MDITIVAAIIFLISFILALRSLRNLTKIDEVVHVKEELKKGKIIYQSDSSSSSFSS